MNTSSILRLSILSIIFIFLGCSKDDLGNELNPFGPDRAVITIDDSTFEMYNFEETRIIGANTNCNNLFVSLNAFDSDFQYVLGISFLKNGELREVTIEDYSVVGENRSYYLSPLYQPEEGIEVERFDYDEENKNLDLRISGKVILEETSGYGQSLYFTVDTQLFNILEIPCSFVINRNIQYNSAQFNFNTIYSSSSFQETEGMRKHFFSSNNGYRLTILTENNPWLMTTGVYSFDSTSTTNTVLLERYKGTIGASQLRDELSEEWEPLEVIGDFNIQSKDVLDGTNLVSGYINMQVTGEDNLQFNVQNMSFQLPDF